MTPLRLSKNGSITLPLEMRRQLGLDTAIHSMVLAEIENGGIFLRPVTAIPVRDIPLDQIQSWIEDDEEGAEIFLTRASLNHKK